jgi:hypothetical protein
MIHPALHRPCTLQLDKGLPDRGSSGSNREEPLQEVTGSSYSDMMWVSQELGGSKRPWSGVPAALLRFAWWCRFGTCFFCFSHQHAAPFCQGDGKEELRKVRSHAREKTSEDDCTEWQVTLCCL